MKMLALGGLTLTAIVAAAPAHADPVGATLLAQYFSVDLSDPDFPGPDANVAPGSSLGPDGLPVASGNNDLNGSNEVTWWSPGFNPHVQATGTGLITLPFASNMFAPNSTGTDDANQFETAILTGNFSLAGEGTVTFNVGSDDDTFVYIDGVLFGQNPGIHAVTTVSFTTPTLDAGIHQLKIFYADRQHVGAYLSLDVASDITITPPSVPEPASWALMLGGFGLVGGALRSRRKAAVSFG